MDKHETTNEIGAIIPENIGIKTVIIVFPISWLENLTIAATNEPIEI